MMETPADRLKAARIRTGHEYAQSFADRHGIPGSTQRAREAGRRKISQALAEEYAGYFRQYPGTRKMTAAQILFAGKSSRPPDPPDPDDSLKNDIDAFNARLTPELRKQLWPFLVQFERINKAAG